MRVCQQYPKAQGQFFAVDAQFGDDDLPIDVLCVGIGELDVLGDCDFLFCCLGGYLLNKVIKYYQQTQTKIISLFPGVVSHYQLDAFISRFNADQVWLNCRADYELYTKLCQVFGVKNNGILYGASWFIDIPSQQSHTNSSTIFFEQTQIITNSNTAQKIEMQLVKIIKNKPNKLFIYKFRQNIHNDFLVKMRQTLARFRNVQLLNTLDNEQIYQADTYLTVSSSAVIEGLLLGKRCYLLNINLLDLDSREIFINSGLFIDTGNDKPNQNWLNKRVYKPLSNISLSGIHKNHHINFTQRNYLIIAQKILRLSLVCPKILKISTNKQKIKSIQKSLEYLS